MAIKQGRYITADTTGKKEMAIRTTELDKVKDDPFVRKSEVQQTVNNSTLPVSSRAVNLAIESINSDLDLKADKSELEGLATEDYVNEKIDEKEIGITEDELISKSIGSDKWMREGAYGVGSKVLPRISNDGFLRNYTSGLYAFDHTSNMESTKPFMWGTLINMPYSSEVDRSNMIAMSNTGETLAFRGTQANAERGWSIVWHDKNTSTDRNGVLHAGTKTPLDTLNTSDMTDTVVDNDLLTVTSGAVFRAIKQLTDQIISLETRVRELEDGGV